MLLLLLRAIAALRVALRILIFRAVCARLPIAAFLTTVRPIIAFRTVAAFRAVGPRLLIVLPWTFLVARAFGLRLIRRGALRLRDRFRHIPLGPFRPCGTFGSFRPGATL